MADPTDIPAPLSDRTLAHGRNVMAAAGVILVLGSASLIVSQDMNSGDEIAVARLDERPGILYMPLRDLG